MDKNKVEEALEQFIKCAEAAANVQDMMDAVLRWKDQLAYLVGQRVIKPVSVSSIRFDSKSRTFRLLDSSLELNITGNISEFQSLACRILAEYPLLPESKKDE